MEDYRVYHYSKTELLCYLAEYLALDAGISYLFYRSWIAFVLFLPAVLWLLMDKKEALKKARRSRLKIEFLTAIRTVATSLNAGYSVENAFAETARELKKIYSEDALIVREFDWIAGQLYVNQPLERLLENLANRSEEEDIQNFSDVFQVAKRSGGDILAIIRNTVYCISQKTEAKREIEVAISAKKMEQKLMEVIPCFILIYVDLGSPEFLNQMYGNLTGICVMTLCLLVYAFACIWAGKITDIEM